MDNKDKLILLTLIGKSIEVIANTGDGSHETDMWKQSLYSLLESVTDSLIE